MGLSEEVLELSFFPGLFGLDNGGYAIHDNAGLLDLK